MFALAETISGALAAVDPGAEERVRSLIAEFDCVYLSDEEKLTAVVSSLAATAWTHHLRYRRVYVDAVKTWALELSGQGPLISLSPRREIDGERVLEAAEVLTCGVDALIEWMGALPVRMQDRLITELVVMARLLGRYDALTIHMATLATDRALGSDDFVPGELVSVPVGDVFAPIGREMDLEQLVPLGFA